MTRIPFKRLYAGPAREDRIEGYFHAVCDAVGPQVPVCFQDFPLATGLPVSPALIRRLSQDRAQIVMLKHEDWPGLEKISTLKAWVKDGNLRPLPILVGNNGLFLDYEMERGADGANTGDAFPDMLVDVGAAVAGRPARRSA